jgi:hypothetical protein
MSTLINTVPAIIPAPSAQNFQKTLSQTVPTKPREKILVCAPSNAAVDEIAYRLLRDGLWNTKGENYTPSIIRIVTNKYFTSFFLISNREM